MDRPEIRSEFPVTERYAYFNNAAVAPLSRPASAAMQAHVAEATREAVHAYAEWSATHEGVRAETATMLGCAADEVAITKNTSEGLCLIAGGLDWAAGDIIVGLTSDFPANYIPWRELRARRGVRFRSLEMRDGELDLHDLDEACKGARLAALSYVHFLTGFRWSLREVGEICRRRDCLLVLDAVQGMGPLPIDVKGCGVHALAASAHKWLTGPEGCAVLYVDRDLIPQLAPVEAGWASFAGFEQYRVDGQILPGARRYECGTLNSVGCAGLRASLQLLNRIGPRTASEILHGLAGRVHEGAGARGYRIAAPGRTERNGSGIVSIRKEGVDSAATARELLRRGISVAERMGWIRVAPHIYNTSEEVDRLLHLLP